MYSRNRYTFGLGTVGRDMVYALFSMYLIFFLTDALALPASTMFWLGGIIVGARIFDALTDPLMGVIVDNTRTRWGKFKPWIAVGTLLSPIMTVLLFTDFGGFDTPGYIARFAVIYVLWGIAFTTHDIAYWSMLPAISVNQKEREKIGSIARICASVGMFVVVVGIVPITGMLGERFGSLARGYTVFAIGVSVLMMLSMCITLFGVKEPKLITAKPQHTPLRELLKIIYKNDQLLYTAIAMVLFMVGYITTTTFGIYFFEYDYGDVGMYAVFAGILGVSQITALAVFPFFAKHFSRRTLFTFAFAIVTAGYIIFFFAPVTTMVFIGIAGVLLFAGQGFIQILMLMFLADSVDYGHWKLGKRNESISFSLQPLINKMGAAIGSGIVINTLIFSGIQDAPSAYYVTGESLLIMRTAMLVLPMTLIAASFILWRVKYKITEAFHAEILQDLRARGEVAEKTT
ncbi:MAG: glycoside-pentoside-hexuronide (GPH):cation symporter [Defluviitaleaceae bacterium]|nr:glycoside-pentoside-hexuronide (GPH):cation symporter [Defluviitaleaceae bacterium]MCL2238779.1 glycoside-pentoside-hexuronide (GPH):cation symporter [Defluviitaleaceae bacterium]